MFGSPAHPLERTALLELLFCASLTAVDGDTVKCDGRNFRDMGDGAPFVSGYDTPEIGRNAECERENSMGKNAMRRMADLLKTPGILIEDSGQIDRYDRSLVVLRLPDGALSEMFSWQKGLRWSGVRVETLTGVSEASYDLPRVIQTRPKLRSVTDGPRGFLSAGDGPLLSGK